MPCFSRLKKRQAGTIVPFFTRFQYSHVGQKREARRTPQWLMARHLMTKPSSCLDVDILAIAILSVHVGHKREARRNAPLGVNG